jgi:chorismate synthase
MLIRNRDWDNWQAIMDPAPREGEEAGALRRRAVTRVRPGHADLTGMLKYDRDDARDILERASARETTARVAAGAIARRLLAELGVSIGSHLVHLGGVDAARPDPMPERLNESSDASPLRTLDPAAEAQMIERIDAAKRAGNTLGGICEVVADGLPVGLGSHVSWDRKLDGRIGAAILSIPAVKGVEIGMGFQAARVHGSEVHDEIEPATGRTRAGNVRRKSNNAGGLTGGISNGEPIVVRGAVKPISTLARPLPSADLLTGRPVEQAHYERSDISVVPAAGVVGEAMVLLTLADFALDKLGGDSMVETLDNLARYRARIGTPPATTSGEGPTRVVASDREPEVGSGGDD